MTQTLPIAHWMADRPIAVEGMEPVLTAIQIMARMEIGAIAVLDGRRVVGMFSERDVLGLFVSSHGVDLDRPVRDFMTAPVVTAAPDDSLNGVLERMKEHGIRHMPIVKDEVLVGMVSMRDLLRAYRHQMEGELADLRLELDTLKNRADRSGTQRMRELQEEIRHLRSLTLKDGLTGLYNTRYFNQRLSEEIAGAGRTQGCVSLVFGDLDLFKGVNDRYGHRCGDEVLKRVAGLLTRAVDGAELVSRLRKSDIVARYGGEEFVIIMPNADKAGALAAAERIRQNVQDTEFHWESKVFHVTISLGVAEYPGDATDEESLIRRADEAMYRAKKSGRNRVEAWVRATKDA